MEEWNLILRILLAVVLLTSGWAKRKEMNKHIGVVIDTRIMPERLAAGFARVDVATEFLMGSVWRWVSGSATPYGHARCCSSGTRSPSPSICCADGQRSPAAAGAWSHRQSSSSSYSN